MLDSQKV
jgi:hypothetical protein